jgi:copper homeostasis protein
MTKIEIATTSVQDALAAQAGGANSIEVSVDLAADGLTPPVELVRQIRAAVQITINVIVRPHNRDFIYTPDEIDLMLRQTRDIVSAGADGIVVGGHLPDGRFDVDLIRRISDAAPGNIITIHRAIDSCTNADEALHQLKGIAHRVLASGKAPKVDEGRETLKQWVAEFGNDFRFVAAGKVRLETAQALVDYTKVHEIHTASAVMTDGRVDVEKVRKLAGLLHLL